METRKLSLHEMEIESGGSWMCGAAASLVGGIWGAAIAKLSFGAAIPVGIMVGTAISTALTEAACHSLS